MQSTDFLDISLNLKNQTYAPYRKTNNEIKYIKTESNHPNSIIKQIPSMIGKRITKKSINNDEFNKVANDYNQALKISGYKESINYEPDDTTKNKRKQRRKTIWYTPPFCKTVKTRIKKKFIDIVKNALPKKTRFTRS